MVTVACSWDSSVRSRVESVSPGSELSDQLDEVAAGHLGVAGHVPRGAEDQRAGQAVGEAARVGHGRRGGALVEADLGVGEVVVVDQQQVRLGPADQLGHLGALAVDVELEPVGAHQLRRPARS